MKALLLALTILALAVPAAAAQEPPPVADVNGAAITQADFDHWLRIANISDAGATRRTRRPLPRPGTRKRRELTEQVMQLLIQNRWVEGEAALHGIVVTERELDRAFREQKRLSFRTEREFRGFLRDSGLNVADIRFRVRLEQLSSELREQVTGTSKDPETQQRRLDRFIADFQRRWKSVTVCREAYATEDCGRTIP